MGTTWIPGAERLGDGSIGGAMDTPNLPPRATWHTTESGAGDTSFKNVGDYLRNIGAEPHVLYDPTTDRLGQFGPLSDSARALRNDGATRTNRTGKVNVQIEVLGRAASPFTAYWRPGPNFRALMAALRSWGIPDVFPLPLARTSSEGTRTRSVWLSEAGHYGHCNVPGNDHWDPGAISPTVLFAAAHTGMPPAREVKWLAVAGFMPELRYGDESWHVDWLQRNLNRFTSPDVPVTGRYDDATARAVHAFYAEHLGYTTTSAGKVFGAGGWRRVLSLASDAEGAK